MTSDGPLGTVNETVGRAQADGAGSSPAAALRRRLLRGSRSVLLAMALAAILGLVVNGLLARLMTHDQFGAYFLVLSIALFGSQLAVVGMDRAVVRMVSAGIGTDEPGKARAAVRHAFIFGAIGSLVVAAVMVVGLGGFLARHVYHSQLVSGAVVFAAAWLIAMALQTLVAETFRGFQRFWMASLFSGLLVDIFSVIVFGLLYVSHAHPTFGQIVLLSIGIVSVSLLVGAFLLGRRVHALGRQGHLAGREMLSIGWPLLVTNILTFMVGTGVDIWIVAAYVPRSELALYGSASRLVFFVGAPFIIVSQVVPPIISELHAQGRKLELEHSLREVATLAGMPAAMVLLTFAFFGQPIMGFVYGEFYRKGATVLAILSAARLFAAITGSSGSLLMMTGHQKTMMRITGVSAVYAVAMELLLARRFGVIGVASATASAQVLQNSLQLAFGKRHLGIWTHAEFSTRSLRELIGR
jgi:O-antigen/teichoic acid export membrane protein